MDWPRQPCEITKTHTNFRLKGGNSIFLEYDSNFPNHTGRQSETLQPHQFHFRQSDSSQGVNRSTDQYTRVMFRAVPFMLSIPAGTPMGITCAVDVFHLLVGNFIYFVRPHSFRPPRRPCPTPYPSSSRTFPSHSHRTILFRRRYPQRR